MTQIPQIPDSQSPQFNPCVKQWIGVRDGIAGPAGLKPDRFVTVGNLYDPVFINALSGYQFPITRTNPSGQTGDQKAPRPPTNLVVTTEVFRNILTWDDPNSDNFWFIEVWRAKVPAGDAAPDVTDAVKIATVPKNVECFIDTEVTTVAYDHYYWIRAVGYDGIASCWQDGYIEGHRTVSATIDNIMEILKGADPDAWSSIVNYVVDDRVLHADKRYKCILANLNQEPPNTTYWERSGILIVGEVGGVSTVGVDGNLIVDGTIYSRCINVDDVFVGMTIQSTIYDPGVTGWQINANGDVDFTSGTATWSLITGAGKPADYADVTPGYPPDSDLIGYWPFDEGSGLFAGDGSQYLNSGTLEGSMTDGDWVSGASGTGLELDGSNDRVNCGTAYPLSNIGNNHDFSISLWMKSHSVINAYSRLFDKTQNSDNRLILYSQNQINELEVYWRSGGVTRSSDTFTDINPWDENLHHIVVVFSFTDGKVYAYQDGVKSAIEPSLSVGNWSNTGDVIWGATSTGGSPYRGMLDEPRIYNKVLTEIEIKALYLYPAGNGASLTLDSFPDGSTYSRVLTTSISAGLIVLSEATGDLDDISNGTYGKVLTTAISGGKILLTSAGCTGTLPTSLTIAKCTDANADQTSAQTGGRGVNVCNTRYSCFEEADLPPVAFGNGSVLQDSNYTYFGVYSLRMWASAIDHFCYLGANTTTYNVKISPNKKWIVSAYNRCNASNKRLEFFIRTSDGNYHSVSTYSHGTLNTWKRVSGVIDLSSNSSTTCMIRIDNEGGNNVIMYFDGIMMEEQFGDLTEPSAYSLPSNIVAANGQNLGWLIGSSGELTISAGGKLKFNCADALEIEAAGNMKVMNGGDIIMHNVTGSGATNRSYIKFIVTSSDTINLAADYGSKFLSIYPSTGGSAGGALGLGYDFLGGATPFNNIYIQSYASTEIESERNSTHYARCSLFPYADYCYAQFYVRAGSTLARAKLYANDAGSVSFTPWGAGVCDLGTATSYWKDVSYKTLTDRGCLGWFDGGVEMPDGSFVSDIEALNLIQKDSRKDTIYGIPMLDYRTMPKAVYKPADDNNGKLYLRDKDDEPYGFDEDGNPVYPADGAEMSALISIMLGAIKQLDSKIEAINEKLN